MNLENIPPNERSQSQRVTHCVIPLMWNVKNRLIWRQKSRWAVPRGCRDGETGSNYYRYGVFFWVMKRFWSSTGLKVAQPYEYTKNYRIVYFKQWILKNKMVNFIRELHLSLWNSTGVKYHSYYCFTDALTEAELLSNLPKQWSPHLKIQTR